VVLHQHGRVSLTLAKLLADVDEAETMLVRGHNSLSSSAHTFYHELAVSALVARGCADLIVRWALSRQRQAAQT
jgi:hypothetical protein